MSEEIRYHKGIHKVKVLTKSKGNWIVEALEPFDDIVYNKRVKVKIGQRRIVAPNLLFKKHSLPPPVKEHTYELKMERKLKRMLKKREDWGESARSKTFRPHIYLSMRTTLRVRHTSLISAT